jgi:hypothetical protein
MWSQKGDAQPFTFFNVRGGGVNAPGGVPLNNNDRGPPQPPPPPKRLPGR